MFAQYFSFGSSQKESAASFFFLSFLYNLFLYIYIFFYSGYWFSTIAEPVAAIMTFLVQKCAIRSREI